MRAIKLLVFAFIICAAVSCTKSSTSTPANPNVTFAATLSGTSETPANASTATAGHIHKGAIGVSGGVIFPFTSLPSPITYTSAALDATQEADLMANLYYVNIHSTAFGGGEIRGQLIKQ